MAIGASETFVKDANFGAERFGQGSFIDVGDPINVPGLELDLNALDPTKITTSGSTITAIADSGPKNRSITVNGSPTYDSELWKRGINLDGTDDHFLVGSAADWAFMHQECTIITAFQSDTKEPDRYNCLVSTTDGNANNIGVRLGQDDRSSFVFDERLSFFVANGSGTVSIEYDDTDNDIDTGKREIYAVQFGAEAGSNNDAKIAVDNSSVGALDIGTAVSTSNPTYTLNVGRLGNANFYSKGKLFRVLIYSRKLTDAEVSAIYTELKTQLTVPRKIITLTGQSNAVGEGATSQLPSALSSTISGAYIWNDTNGAIEQLVMGTNNEGASGTQHGIEATLMSKAVADFGEDVILFKYGAGGTSLHTDWYPETGTNWIELESRWTDFLAELDRLYFSLDTEGMVWYQGENDGDNSTNAGNYGTNLAVLKSAQRQLFQGNLFIEPKLYVPDDTYPEWETVNTAKQTAATNDNSHYYVDEAVASIDDVHLTSRSLGRVGYAVAGIITGVTRTRLEDVISPFVDHDTEDQDRCLDTGGNVVDAGSTEDIATITDKGSAGLNATSSSGTRPVYNTGAAQFTLGDFLEAGDEADFEEYHELTAITTFIVSRVVTENTGAILSTNDGSFGAGLSVAYFDDDPFDTLRIVGGTGAGFLVASNGSTDDYDVGSANSVNITVIRIDDAAASDYRIYNNGTSSIAVNKAIATVNGNSQYPLHLGIRGSELAGFDGEIMRHVCVKETMTDAEINQVGQALAEDYGGTWTDI